MRLHRMHGGVQAQGCAFVRAMAANDGLKTTLAEAGGRNCEKSVFQILKSQLPFKLAIYIDDSAGI